MNAQPIDWSSGLLILVAGLVVGALLVWRARRARVAPPHADAQGVEQRDLQGRRDALVAQLRELDDTAVKLTSEQLQSERAALELELARVLQALDAQAGPGTKARGKHAEAATPAGAAPQSATAATVRGFLWGVAAMVALGALFLWVSRDAAPRGAGETATGNLPERGSAREAAQPPSAEEQQLRAALEKNPDDYEARIALTQLALRKSDMMGVWNETQAILQRKPGDPRALSYQALVRVRMGQPEMAVAMLQQALKAEPDLAEAYVHLTLVYLQLGREKEADALMADARKRFPEDAPTLTKVYAEMRARVQAEGTEPPAEGENPHARVDGPPPTATAPATGAAPAPAAAPPAPPGAGDPKRRVQGQLELDPALAGQVPKGVVIFVMARPAGAAGGPPIAVRRLAVDTFPAAFEIGDGDSMAGEPLPEKLRVEARLDTDGDAATRDPNDARGVQDPVALGTSGVKLLLKR